MYALNDILRVALHFEQGTNTGLLVQFYEITALIEPTIVPMSQIAQGYHEQFADSQVPEFLHSTANFRRTVIDNMTDGLSFGDYENAVAGGQLGDPAPALNAMSIKQAVQSRLTRNGFKRLPFISELAFFGNTLTLSVPQRGAIETWWGQELTIFNPLDAEPLIILSPVVVGRVESPPDSGIYVLDLTKINPIVSAEAQRPTSQNSRKP